MMNVEIQAEGMREPPDRAVKQRPVRSIDVDSTQFRKDTSEGEKR
jgi:hypothetical protein